MESPVEKDKLDHFKKWYDRCAVNLADGQYIKDMWAEWDQKRKMVDPKNLPSPLAQARSNLPPTATQDTPASAGNPPTTGKNEGNATVQGDGIPPHSPGGGTQSSPSAGGTKPGAPQATGHCGSGQGQNGQGYRQGPKHH